jgi:hypothetical protein
MSCEEDSKTRKVPPTFSKAIWKILGGVFGFKLGYRRRLV